MWNGLKVILQFEDVGWLCTSNSRLIWFWPTPNPLYSQLTLIPQWERESDRVFLWSTNLSNNSSLVQRGLKGNERIAVCDSPSELNNVVPDSCDECLIYVRKQCLSLTLGLELCHWVGKLHSVDLLCTVNCVKWLWSNMWAICEFQVDFSYNCFAISRWKGKAKLNKAIVLPHFDGPFSDQIDWGKYFSEAELL